MFGVMEISMTYAVDATTVSFPSERCFGWMDKIDAEDVFYNHFLPSCEEQGIFLSDEGNVGGTWTVERYDSEKSTFFPNVEKIQHAFRMLMKHFKPTAEYVLDSRMLTDKMNREHAYEHTTFSQGDCIAAMMLLGFDARFPKIEGANAIHCDFKTEWVS
jgi:hypothetical protein